MANIRDWRGWLQDCPEGFKKATLEGRTLVEISNEEMAELRNGKFGKLLGHPTMFTRYRNIIGLWPAPDRAIHIVFKMDL